MSEENDILKYEFKKSFEIAKGGEQERATFLEITAPTNTVIKHVSFLDKEMHKGLFKMSSGATEQDIPEGGAKEITSDELMMALASSDVKLDKCYNELLRILEKNCKINGVTKFTEPMFNKMHYSDTKSLLGEYLKFFLCTSLLS